MLHHLKIHTDQGCPNQDCAKYGTRFSVLEKVCPACGRNLDPQFELNWHLILPLLGGFLLLAAALALVVSAIRSSGTATREIELLAQAEQRLTEALVGASTAKVPSIVDRIQQELGLDDSQRAELVERLQPRLEALPRNLDADSRKRLEELFRQVYRDSQLSATEQERIEQFVEAERLVPQEVKDLEGEVAGKAEAANRHLSRGKNLVSRGRMKEARSEFLRATEADPRDPLAWTELGAANAVLGMVDEALECYETAIALDPHQWLAHFNLGLLAVRGGDLEIGLRHLEHAVASLPAGAPRERRSLIRELLEEPALGAVRDDPRFSDLLAVDGGILETSGR